MGVLQIFFNQHYSLPQSVTQMSESPISDSLKSLPTGSFLETGNKLFEVHHSLFNYHSPIHPYNHWAFYLLFGFISIFAVIRYYYPHAYRALLMAIGKTSAWQENESKGAAGLMVPLFLFINFLVSMGLLFFVSNQKFNLFRIFGVTPFEFFLFSCLVVLLYYFLNEIVILFVGFLFGTSKHALLHVKTGSHIANFLGMILNPLLLFYFFTNLDLFFYLALSAIVLALLFKWVLLFKMGLSLIYYSPFHIILYLCTLEIIPIMLLIKVGQVYM